VGDGHKPLPSVPVGIAKRHSQDLMRFQSSASHPTRSRRTGYGDPADDRGEREAIRADAEVTHQRDVLGVPVVVVAGDVAVLLEARTEGVRDSHLTGQRSWTSDLDAAGLACDPVRALDAFVGQFATYTKTATRKRSSARKAG
jgi:hypothetical protein